MAQKNNSGIEWTGPTWNFLRGCNEESAGCANCYARAFAERWRGTPGNAYRQGFDLRLVPHKLPEPLAWTTPVAVFANSMSDPWQRGRRVRGSDRKVQRDAQGKALRSEGFPWWYLAAAFGVMAAAREHTFQVLTKGPDEALAFFTWMRKTFTPASLIAHARSVIETYTAHVARFRAENPELRDVAVLTDFAKDTTLSPDARARLAAAEADPPPWPLQNVHLGVSIEDRHELWRLAALRRLRGEAGLLFLSLEPLLEDLGPMDLTDVGVVIVGGESGPSARAMEYAWARAVRDQCRAQNVRFFFKQAGFRPRDAGDLVTLVARKGNDLKEIPEDLRIRETPPGWIL